MVDIYIGQIVLTFIQVFLLLILAFESLYVFVNVLLGRDFIVDMQLAN